MENVKDKLTEAMKTPRKLPPSSPTKGSRLHSASSSYAASPYGTPSTSGGWFGPSLHDDDLEIQEMLDQVDNLCSEVESRCTEPLKTEQSLRVRKRSPS